MTSAPKIQRGFSVVLSRELSRSREFYLRLLDFRVVFDSDWFVHLQAEDVLGVELGLMSFDHDLVPASFRGAQSLEAQSPKAQSGGVMITIVVDDVDAVHERAKSMDVVIVEPPRDLFYGQRRMLVTDPDGTLLDISSECAPSPEFLASLSETDA